MCERAGPMPTLIKERYEILETLGAGGEGRVVKALDRQHERLVALKIRPVRDDQAREELLTEARILLAIPPHPALPLVREDFFDGDDYFVAMDWVDGTDLATLLRDRGRPGLAPSSVLAYLSQAAEALTHLHSQVPPVIHGDVKPANLILTKGGRIKLVDFGISSAPNALRRRVGTPGYRAPELASDGAPSRASDIYALAATAFALLTGSAPAGVLPAWEGIEPAQAEQLEAAIRMGMATDPARRPATPGELIERLRAGWAEALPTGVVTFCLSDIEGSSAMWSADPAAMAEALVRHDELIADCVESRGGRFLKSMGEATRPSRCSTRRPTRSPRRSPRRARCRPSRGRRICRSRFASASTPARPNAGAPTTSGRRSTSPPGSAIRPTAGRSSSRRSRPSWSPRICPTAANWSISGRIACAGSARPSRSIAVKAPGIRAPLPRPSARTAACSPSRPRTATTSSVGRTWSRELIQRLECGRLVAVVGASGSGKSSVLRAGSDRGGARRRGRRHRARRAADAGRLSASRRRGRSGPAGRGRSVRGAVHPVRGRRTAGRRSSMRCWRYGVRWRSGCGPTCTASSLSHPELARAVVANQLLLGAMSDEELERAVTEPARLAGLRLEPGLVELAVRDVAGEPGALPLLSHALRATWERREGRTLTVEGYRDSGRGRLGDRPDRRQRDRLASHRSAGRSPAACSCGSPSWAMACAESRRRVDRSTSWCPKASRPASSRRCSSDSLRRDW